MGNFEFVRKFESFGKTYDLVKVITKEGDIGYLTTDKFESICKGNAIELLFDSFTEEGAIEYRHYTSELNAAWERANECPTEEYITEARRILEKYFPKENQND